jgi:adenine-specific DNA-methyltransferase
MRRVSSQLNALSRGVVGNAYRASNCATLFTGDRLDLLKTLPDGEAKLCVTSPPYNIGKTYESRVSLSAYLDGQRQTISECVRVLADDGSLCWQVGNHVNGGQQIYPLDIFIYQICQDLGLKLRNRIIWAFEHGLNCKKRFSGRYETILWFTKSDKYIFNLDPVRVPQKYPGKTYYRGPKTGQYSCNPLGKNPGDIWTIPNVKHNHIEKTVHPCQFPIELVERLVLGLTNKRDLVVDPYAGVASALCAAVRHDRRAAGSEILSTYSKIGKERLENAIAGTLRVRPMHKPVYEPDPKSKVARKPEQMSILSDAWPSVLEQ